MPIRRRTVVPRRPEPALAGIGRAVVADVPAEVPVDAEGPDDGTAALRRKVAADFAAKVRERGLPEDEVESLIHSYTEAVQSVELTPALRQPDRSQWVEMVDLMVQAGMLQTGDSPSLIRMFDEVFEGLESPELGTLMEFSRRCQEDGQEQAVAWLESRREADAQSKRATSEAPPAVLGLSLSQNAQKGRRVRGPPR